MELEAILLKLDDHETTVPPGQPQTAVGSQSTAIDFTSNSVRLKTAVDEQDAIARLLADQVRQQTGKLGDKHPEVAKLRQELDRAVMAGFEAKILAEQLQIEQLQERLAKLRTQLQIRKASSRKIIDRRVRELLEPDPLRWNPETSGSATRSNGSTTNAGADLTPQPKPKPIVVDLYAPSGIWKNQAYLTKIVQPLNALPGVTTNLRNIPGEGDSIAMVIVRVPAGAQANPGTRGRIDAALSGAGITKVRWEDEQAETEQEQSTNSRSTPGEAATSSPPEPMPNHTQIHFVEPTGMRVTIENKGVELTIPFRFNLERSKKETKSYPIWLNSEGGPAKEKINGILGIFPSDARTAAFLQHRAVPLKFTDEDLDQIKAGNTLTKVLYLPMSDQQPKDSVVETIASTRLDPNVDPITEAARRGSILIAIQLHHDAAAGDPITNATIENDLRAKWIWNEMGLMLAPTTDPKLLPRNYRGGLLITRVDPAKAGQLQVGDVLLGIHKWETLSLDNVLFILRQAEVRPERTGQVRSIRIYTAHNSQVQIQQFAFDGAKPHLQIGTTAATKLSLDQWIVMLHKNAEPARAIDVIHAIGQFGKGEDAERAASTLLAASDSIDPADQSVVPRELLRALQSIDHPGLIGPLIEALRNGTSRVKYFALASVSDLKDFTAADLFLELVKLIFQMADCDDARLRVVAQKLLLETMPITSLNPAELSTEERRQMVQRLKENVPPDRVWQLILKGLDDPNVEVALTSATNLIEPPDPTDAKTSAKVLDLLIKICRGKLGEETADRYQRGRALYQLTLLGPKAASAVPMLMDLLKSDDPDLKPLEYQSGGRKGYSFTRNRIIILLEQIGPAAKDVLPELELMLATAEKLQQEDDRLKVKRPSADQRPFDLAQLKRAIDAISGKTPVRSSRPSPFD
jgi:hypothetical protein